MYKEVLYRHFINLRPFKGSDNAAVSRMVLFATKVNGFWVLAIAIKDSLSLNVAGFLYLPPGSTHMICFTHLIWLTSQLICAVVHFSVLYMSLTMVLSRRTRFLRKNQHSLLPCYWNDCSKTFALISKKILRNSHSNYL